MIDFDEKLERKFKLINKDSNIKDKKIEIIKNMLKELSSTGAG